MNTFVLKDVNSDTTIEFSGEVPRGLVDYEDCNFVASIKGQQLSATVTVCDIHPDAWSKFFADIAENWQGWFGEKESESLEGHLKLTVKSDSLGHIRVRVLLRNVNIGGEWSVEDSVYLEAGQLAAIAMEAKEFFG
jgi:hypothetical protein